MHNHILKAQNERGVMYSFEFFPPKDEAGEARLWSAIDALESIAPDFISVTYGAGGSTRDRTIRIASEIFSRTQIPTVAHLTCVGSSESDLVEILTNYRSAGIENVLALRGDPVGGPRSPWVTTPGGYEHSDQLVSLAKSMDFNVGVASFPDTHPNSDGNLEKDIEVLLEKERRGATFSTTQFFFQVDKWKQLVDSLASRGSSMPVFPGILPVTNVKQLHRMAELSGTPIPTKLAEKLLAASDSPEDVYAIGVEHAISMCQELLAAGAPGIHFYTMNTSPATREIYEEIKGIRP